MIDKRFQTGEDEVGPFCGDVYRAGYWQTVVFPIGGGDSVEQSDALDSRPQFQTRNAKQPRVQF